MSEFELVKALQDLVRRVHLLETTQVMGYSSVSEGHSRFVGNESILVQGSGKVEGWWIVTGTQRVTGLLDGSGTLDWTGPWALKGNGSIPGNVSMAGAFTMIGPMAVAGTLNVTGAATFGSSVDVLNRLTLGPSGYIQAGTVRIDRAGSYGGRVASSGSVLELAASGSVIIDAPYLVASAGSFTDLSAIGTISANIKNFKIPHPTKPDHWLRHGSTESPVSGVEYCGDERLPSSGTFTVELPDYFEALTKPDGRVVFVTGRGFVADWGDIEAGKFTVTGKPGGRISWLVKAERTGGDFLLEEPIIGPQREGA